MTNAVFEGTCFLVCAFLNAGSGKEENTFYQWE